MLKVLALLAAALFTTSTFATRGGDTAVTDGNGQTETKSSQAFGKPLETCIQEMAKAGTLALVPWSAENTSIAALKDCTKNQALQANDLLKNKIESSIKAISKTQVAANSADPKCLCYKKGPKGTLLVHDFTTHMACVGAGLVPRNCL